MKECTPRRRCSHAPAVLTRAGGAGWQRVAAAGEGHNSFGTRGSGCSRALTGAGGDGLGRSARWPTMPKKEGRRVREPRRRQKSQALHTHAHTRQAPHMTAQTL